MFNMSYRLLCSLIIVLFLSCKNEEVLKPDVSAIKLDNSYTTFLPDFTQESLEQIDSTFVDLYISQVLGIASKDRNNRLADVNEIFSEDWAKELSDTIRLEFGNLETLNNDFEKAFKYLKHYFPAKQTPNIYYCNTLFNYQRFLFEDSRGDAIGIGLDMFLKDYYDYKMIDPQNPAFSDYLTINFNKRNIVPKSLSLVVDEIVGPITGSRFIDKMIHNGKKIYILELILPDEDKHLLHEYSTEQYKWCEDSEFEIWSFFNSEKLMYDSTPQTLNKYLNESPTSPGMPEQSPGRTGSYIGWKIVKKWASLNNGDWQKLLNTKEAQKILDEAKYRPKRK